MPSSIPAVIEAATFYYYVALVRNLLSKHTHVLRGFLRRLHAESFAHGFLIFNVVSNLRQGEPFFQFSYVSV